MKKLTLILAVLMCLSLLGCGNQSGGNTTPTETTEPAHIHTFEEWRITGMATCRYEGVERRTCTECKYEEKRTTETLPHTFKEGSYICSVCRFVNIEADEAVVEMGNMLSYEAGNTANYAWDIQVWDGKIYRGAGDYDKNSGDTPIMAFNLAEGRWETTGTATDEAIHRFVEIDGKLYAPGIDSRDSGGWDLGNYYVLEGDKWQKVRNVPKGIHCFDMIGFDGKMFIAVGTGESHKVIGMSTDKGASWTYLPMYKDGALLDASGHDESWSRGYEFAELNGKLYALVIYKEAAGYVREIYRYEGDKMVYAGRGDFGARVSRNYWQSKVEFNGKCYIAANDLYVVSDFAQMGTLKRVKMPNNEKVSDAILYNNELYALTCLINEKDFTVVIYKSATGETGSFTEVARFNYGARPYSFDYDGKYFYVGTGIALSEEYKEQVGMVLRVKPNA